MKYLGLLLIVSLAGLHLALSQVSDCTDISIGLQTFPIAPVTGKMTMYVQIPNLHTHDSQSLLLAMRNFLVQKMPLVTVLCN